ncbi:MAG: hypothetical protein ACJ71Q_20055 [Terriglobales bacterium]
MPTLETPSTAAPRRSGLLSYLSLFTSVGTLLCCALPSLLVLLGLGASVGSLLSDMPWLVTLSHHKPWVFTISGGLIALSFVQMYAIAPRLQRKDAACSPDDPSACETAGRFGKVMLWLAATLYAVGFFTAFILGPLLAKLDR